jgi:hypothetical protein
MTTKTFEVEIEVKGRWTLRIRAPNAYAARDLSHSFNSGGGTVGGIIKATRLPFTISCVSAPVEIPEDPLVKDAAASTTKPAKPRSREAQTRRQ